MAAVAGRLILLLLLCVPSCITTPQPVRYECPERLIQQWQWTYCMTGPYPWLVDYRPPYAGPRDRLCDWCCREVTDPRILARFMRAVLPGPCGALNTDGDYDVDLRDWSEWQNDIGR